MESAFHRPRRLSVYREKSDSVKTLMEALPKAMAEFAPIAKDGKGKILRNGKTVEYRYATLDSLHRSTKPALLKFGVVPIQEYCVSDEGVTLVTTLHCGEEYITSVLPIRQYEDQQRLKAHMSYMRRTAYEGILCLSAEDDGDGAEEQLPPGTAGEATEPTSVPAHRMWKHQEMLARQAIADAKTPAMLADILSKVKKKITDCDMDPHSIGVVEEAIRLREDELKRSKNGKETAK